MRTQSKYRLLVVRLGAMGDILHALPAVTALRKMHPYWVIDWVVEPIWKDLLSADDASPERGPARPLVDRVHLACTKAWRRSPLQSETRKAIGELRSNLKSCTYDTVLDLQGALRSAAVARLTGCRRRIGEARPRETAARWLFTERVDTVGRHVIEQDVEVASAIAGDDLQPVRPMLPVDPAAESWCDSLLEPLGGKPLVLLNPGAGWGAKRWPVERYASVAKGLTERGFCILVNSGPGEEAIAADLREQSGGCVVTMSCSVAQLIAATRRVRLAIAGDTGPLHLACALGRPVVGIYGPTDPGRNGPYGVPFRVLRNPESRRDHSRREAPEAGLLTISPDDVLRASDELLQEECV